MTLLAQQFEIFKSYEPKASLESLPDGSHLITVSDVQLPSGWSKESVTVWFIAPVAYPMAPPDCFWTDPDLLLMNGSLPQNTGQNPIPHVGSPTLWFSWHVSTWSPNSDSLMTYMNVIKRRLHDPR